MCYYDTALGRAQWEAPAGSGSLSRLPLVSPPQPFLEPPPCFPRGLGLNSLRGTGWHALFRDADGCVHLYHAETGAVRSAPWIALRTDAGTVFFINLVTGVSRWMPPHRWMETWVSRPGAGGASGPGQASPFFDCRRLEQQLRPQPIARCRVEGGAPYFHARGLPPWAADATDTAMTHPALAVTACA